MGKKNIYLGNTLLNSSENELTGQFVEIEGEKFYKISNYNQMPDFFISVISNSNHWMFISSNGSLSAGRKDRDNALFPYFTEDKIHDYNEITGSNSSIIIERDGKRFLWKPFTSNPETIYLTERNIYKSIYGNKIIFEEINHDLQVSFQYGWYNSDKFGFVKKSKIRNLSNSKTNIEILDGIKNILPSGTDYNFQNEYSNLLDAYKKNELIKESGLGLFSLSSIPVDRAEPSESLSATTVWSIGLKKPKILLSNNQIDLFIKGDSLETEIDVRGRRGAYFLNQEIILEANSEKNWMIIAELNQDSSDVSNLNQLILSKNQLEESVIKDISEGTDKLKRMVSFADGFQMTNTDLCYARHYSNTMYNIMRGGVFANNYIVKAHDFKDYLAHINKLLSKEFQLWLDQIPDNISYMDLIELAEKTKNYDLVRITYEYLPLTFSRRHGDPSRPWNLFSIETKNEDGSVKYNYQGNWRDIFQNWEALCYSYPEFIEGIIAKFVNATTIDGYNPYRIMRDGIDWESPDPDDPWSYIGYWGDHQIIYLQKLLELSNSFHPGKLDKLLTKEIFTYANVPYQIKPYKEIVKNPKDTIVFNEELNDLIKEMEIHVGADAKLLKNRDIDKAYKANLMEKILVTLLSKLSNFIPEAGIWLNTQRPEWNDANNALVGNGASMVTLYYLRRFLKFWENKISSISISTIPISHEVLLLFENIYKIFNENQGLINKEFNDNDRKRIVDLLGNAHSDYRNEIYKKSFNGRKRNLNVEDLLNFTKICLRYIDQSIQKNKRDDGLYHAYNLISIKDHKISIRNLYEMLEGQVAILSSGLLSTKESLEVLDSLKKSKMYRPDQYSYMLYPDRQLKRFTEKNNIPNERFNESDLLKKLLNNKENSIIKSDDLGNFFFNKDIRNEEILKQKLDELVFETYDLIEVEEIETEKEKIFDIYEEVFDHQSFTGRSGTFYGYEGLGSIYWHMVSKLLLATQECYFKAIEDGSDIQTVSLLKDHYYEIKAGIGLYKSPELYGAFPTDAYSHTPGNAGVKQPGLTGQVKEDVISRIAELGIRIKDGKIMFDASLLNDEEILDKKQDFEYYSLNGEKQILNLNENQLALTFCQVPFIYTFSNQEKISITFKNDKIEEIQGNSINEQISSSIFNRTEEVKLVEVTIKKDN